MISKLQLAKLPTWHFINYSASDKSGWKLTIYGEDIDDSYTIGVALEPVVVKYSISMKIAAQRNLDAGIGIKGNIQYGKAGTVYLTPTIFKEGLLARLLKEIQTALANAMYTKKGHIHGSKSIDGTIFYRYELYLPVDPAVGVDYEGYVRAYEPNRGHFNIPNNPDIEHLLKEDVCQTTPSSV